MNLLKDVKEIGTEKYTRLRGMSMTLQELLEKFEKDNEEFTDRVLDDCWYTPDEVEYTITVNGKDVDAKSVKINLYDSDDALESFYDEDGNSYSDEEINAMVNRLNELSKCSKEKLIEIIADLERDNN